ncbi:P-loop containing nucleoside triphosphate hydrolase protein [Rickenella mellea]|uniref:P-loop containing nucleoside triphosphate hydrolase protein n=1 Tax=Rickenella mellea TaxID=50990 RepID=A0A4Y7QBT0_9AGAM|nr:P-loop containing nucleoside triphosphate hydrolase protein [Rickenella mellea]
MTSPTPACRNSRRASQRSSTLSVPRSTSVASTSRSHVTSISTPRPTLLFAIASDDVSQVRRVLEAGDASPNDQVGPQSALAFTLMNEQLKQKDKIARTLLAYGADPSSLDASEEEGGMGSAIGGLRFAPELDNLFRYCIAMAKAAHTRQAAAYIQGSDFRSLTGLRFDLIGQDRALEQLFRVLGMHAQQSTPNPLVMLYCGPSGSGKSHLARKFGYLLDVPTHTVNMTTMQSTHDLWQSHSMGPYEEPSKRTLAEFLIDNEGKRCVVVLDELEKCENERNLWSLLAPWELGEFDAGSRHIDVRKVVWIGTSNIGTDLISEYDVSRVGADADLPMSRQEYVELMALLRPRISARLGASIMSRVTTVLPFVPFTRAEQFAIASEVLAGLGKGYSTGQGIIASKEAGEKLIEQALAEYVPAEGFRSLQRAVSTHWLDVF